MAFQSGGFQPANAAPDNRFNSTIVPVESMTTDAVDTMSVILIIVKAPVNSYLTS